ncbi:MULTISPECIES: hypothetical protein [Alphaproteobacteria]|uniref:hypothetical protein n=1 Tax=Alphaproteobacteria TaxID=28211 RepID=UPI00329A1EA2
MVHVHGKARIRHAETGEVYEITPDMIDFQSVGSEERSMGAETTYSAVVDHPQLGQLVWSIWEYPEGAENDRETDVGQHELLENVDFELGQGPFDESEADEGDAADDRQARIDALVEWFHEHYEDPAHRLPYESAEGGYQWIYGGPYDAQEALSDNFQDEPEDIIEAAVEEIESEGQLEWSPVPTSEDYDPYDEDEHEDSDPNELANELAGLIADLPMPTTDPVFERCDDGLIHMALPPDAAVPTAQDTLLDELRAATEDLLQSLAGTNGHPDLLRAAERYSEATSGETVSISQVYARGIRLTNAKTAAESAIANDDQPPLPAGVEEHLSSVVELNRAYVMSQPEGRAIAEGADAYRRTPAEAEAMRRAAQQLTSAVEDASNLFGHEVRTHVAEVAADVARGPQPERSNQAAATTFGSLTITLLKYAVPFTAATIASQAIGGSIPADALAAAGTASIDLVWTFLTAHASIFRELAGAFGADLSWMTPIARLLERIKQLIRR